VAEHCRVAGVAVRACCLMPNHVHLILVSPDGDGRGLRELRQYIVAT